MRRLILFVLAGAVAALVGAPAAVADDRICSGTIGAISTDDNIVVPGGASCRLEGTRTGGNVLIRGGGTLTALGVRVDGNIQGERHARVTVAPLGAGRPLIDGNIQLERGGPARVDRATIDGNLQVEGANGRQTATGNVIDGDLQAFGNRGGFEITGNRIHGNLQCSGNVPAPHGGQNTVAGDREGQCATLAPRPPSNGPGPPPPPPGQPPSAAGPRLAMAIVGGRQLRRVFRVRVRCAVACTVRTRASVVVRRPGRRLSMRVRPRRVQLAARQARAVRLVLGRRQLRTVRRLIRNRGARARVVVRARAIDARGRTEVERRAVGPLRVR